MSANHAWRLYVFTIRGYLDRFTPDRLFQQDFGQSTLMDLSTITVPTISTDDLIHNIFQCSRLIFAVYSHE